MISLPHFYCLVQIQLHHFHNIENDRLIYFPILNLYPLSVSWKYWEKTIPFQAPTLHSVCEWRHCGLQLQGPWPLFLPQPKEILFLLWVTEVASYQQTNCFIMFHLPGLATPFVSDAHVIPGIWHVMDLCCLFCLALFSFSSEKCCFHPSSPWAQVETYKFLLNIISWATAY